MALFRRREAVRHEPPVSTADPNPIADVAEETAQDVYKAMLKDAIGPRLRALGFKGSAGTYTKPSETHFIQLGFQKSAWNDRHEVRFTINVSVIDKSVWAETRKENWPAVPIANRHYGSLFWQRRISGIREDMDTWWQLSTGTAYNGVAAAVLADIEEIALPAMEEQTKLTR